MTRRNARHHTAGTSFVELMIAVAIVGATLMFLLQEMVLGYRENALGEDQAFAYRKAMSMLEELQSAVERRDIASAAALEALADTDEPNALLTITVRGDDLAPDHPTSGNWLRDGQWAWARKLSVQNVQADDRLRYVRVELWDAVHGRTAGVHASLGAIVNLSSSPTPTVKEYDVYVLAIGAAPSCWSGSARSLVQMAADEIAATNPSLRFRLHWITRLGYGRDALYTPFVNQDAAADVAAPWVYWYPGKLGPDADVSTLYAPELLGGRVRTETALLGGYHATENRHPVAVADQWNHCMRAPEARELFELRVAAGVEKRDEPPLQVLLDDMASRPDAYRNAILVNLHGEGLPCPPLRNYSDAAKAPERLPGVRVVTHPGRLRPARDPNADGDHADTDDLDLYVYAYKTDPAAGPALLTEPITVQIFGSDLSAGPNSGAAGTLTIRRLVGGVDPVSGVATSGGKSDYSHMDDGPGLPPRVVAFVGSTGPLELDDDSGKSPFQMCYAIGYSTQPEPHTWIRLYNTPLVTPQWNDEGLYAKHRLYGMEYVPSPISASAPFSVDPDSDGDKPKNTARWRIRIPKTVFGTKWANQDVVVRVTTRIGADITTGRVWPTPYEPANRSTTYAWWASSPNAVPLTERYQLLGDPRHNPYADLCVGGASFPHGYNWFFDDLRHGSANAADGYPCLDAARLRDGFGSGVVGDVPRMMQIWRDALQASASVFVQGGGRLAGAVLHGGEIALAGTGGLAPLPVTVAGAWFGMSGTVRADSMSSGAILDDGSAAPMGETAGSLRLGRQVVVGQGFQAMEWLGELAPDSLWSAWVAGGNAPTGGTLGLWREVRELAALPALPAGTSFAFPSGSRLGDLGGASLLQTGTSTGFAQLEAPADTVLQLADPVRAFCGAAGVVPPTTVAARLPFALDAPLSRALPQAMDALAYPSHYAHLLASLTTDTGASGAGIVRLLDPSGQRRAWFAVLGNTPVTGEEHEFLAQSMLLLGLRAMHVAGEPMWSDSIDQVPQLLLSSPAQDQLLTRPQNVMVRWQTNAVRFDGQPYTERYSEEAPAAESRLAYVVTWSSDTGQTWRYAWDGDLATPGERPTDPYDLLWDAGAGDESFVMAVPASTFPAGEYLVRVDCFHRDRALHVSHHEVGFRIER